MPKALSKYELIANERYRLLIAQLGEGGRAQEEVAADLGTIQAQVSRIAKGERFANLKAIARAVEVLHLHPSFFFLIRGEGMQPLRYTDFVGPHKIPPRGGYAAMIEFLESEDAADITDEERGAIERQRWDGEPTRVTYALFLSALRSLKRGETAVRKRKQTPSSARKL